MTADALDIAADRAELERATAVARHLQRPSGPVPLCEECADAPVHVTASGTRWRFCPEEHLAVLRGSQTA